MMVETEQSIMKEIDTAFNYISGLIPSELAKPQVGIICGSALINLGQALESAFSIPYSHIPGFPRSNVAGHQNIMKIGKLNGVVTVLFLGRFHGYEGLPIRSTGLIVRILARLGVPNLIITNSVGSCNVEVCRTGDFLVVEDHISFPTLSGMNPLVGPNLGEFGPRFFPMDQCYHPGSILFVTEAAKAAGIDLDTVKRGVYGHVSGPVFETPAETKYFKSIGCAAIGSGTVPEVITAAHCKKIKKTVVIGLITNQPAVRGSMPTGREEVEAVMAARSAEFQSLVSHLAPILAKAP